jgi:methanogenic corrinoid protein MtbC1
VSAPIRPVYDAYVRALRSGDRHRAFRIVADARAAGHGIEALYLEVLQALYEDIFQQQEAAAGTKRPLLVGACAPRERHEIGLRMLCDLLELDGWDTVYLGASVPDEALVVMLQDRRPDVLALSASTSPQITDLEATIRHVRAALDRPPFIIVGGRAFFDDPELAARIGADGVAPDARAAVRMLARHGGRQ